jgi:hypothetical protein
MNWSNASSKIGKGGPLMSGKGGKGGKGGNSGREIPNRNESLGLDVYGWLISREVPWLDDTKL